MEIFGLTVTRAKASSGTLPGLQPPVSRGGLGWTGFLWPVIRESFTGAWQRNVDLRADSILSYFAVFACVTLIASDIGKCRLRLVIQDKNGIWTETTSPAFSPVLRKPNHYQTINKLIEQWIVSKLVWGNTYVLKQRDARGVVIALYVLNPARVHPLVTTDGDVYYELDRDDLSDLPEPQVIVPASEIIHDTMICLFHPLIGVTPIFACGLAAAQGLKIQGSSLAFFGNGSMPGGILTAPGAISDLTAQRLRNYWNANYTGENVGKVAVLGDGLKYESMTMNAVDAQLIDQLKWTAENVCSCYHVPAYMIGVGPPPPYANVEPLVQQYYSQCLQSLMTNLETSYDDGVGLQPSKIDGQIYGSEFDIDDLIWMNALARGEAAGKSAGTLAPNEARKKYYGVGPVTGGDSPMVQQQYYSLEALAARDAEQPFAKAAPATPPPPTTKDTAADVDEAEAAEAMRIIRAA